jgi:hypothetical protein
METMKKTDKNENAPETQEKTDGRKNLGKAKTEAKAKSRKETMEKRKAARDLLAKNPQFLNEKFWNTVDSETLETVATITAKAQKTQAKKNAKANVKKLEAELAKKQAELEEQQAKLD